jgi:hypothetical protein
MLRHKYTALSYTWGDDPTKVGVPVLCTRGCEHIIRVTKSLVSAIQEIRQTDRCVDLWVDQISVNQSSNSEKSSQISLMKIIYERVSTVLVWLGEAADGSDLAIDRLNISHEQRRLISDARQL